MTLRIAGIGLAVPEHCIDQQGAAEMMLGVLDPGGGRERTVRALYKRSGVRNRHSVLLGPPGGSLEGRQSFYTKARDEVDAGPTTRQRMEVYERSAPGLMLQAARAALADSGLHGQDITQVVTVSCTGFISPGLDAALIHSLDLPPSVGRTHIGFMGCHASLNGLRVASSFTSSDPQARVLMCSVELCSLHMAYGWNPETLVANALFADGAAALVGVPAAESSVNQPGGRDWTVAASGTLLLPDSEDAMSWKVGDHGFRMTLSTGVPDLIRAHMGDWLVAWLGEHDLEIDDIQTWAVHPGGPRVLTAFGDSVGLEKERLQVSRDILAEYGNMSSATLLFILDRLRRAEAQTPCVALAFGPGLVAEVALIR